jgi:signal peptidase I
MTTITQLPIYQPSGIITGDLAYYLTLACLITGFAGLLRFILRWRQKHAGSGMHPETEKQKGLARVLYILLEHPGYNIVDWFGLLLVVLILRSFVFQLYRVPTGSLEPTVMPGDILLVNQFAYGLHLPVTHYEIINLGKPNRGDIAVFRWPVNPKIVFVKRVIGLPGDHIVYKKKRLSINGHLLKMSGLVNDTTRPDAFTPSYKAFRAQETLLSKQHDIFLVNQSMQTDGYGLDIIVPAGQYFMMGDNRDLSNDSRFWGFVPENDFIGRATTIIVGTNKSILRPNWDRFMLSL